MPRNARIGAPGSLDHLIVRGIERSEIFEDDADRDSFIERLGQVSIDTRTHHYPASCLYRQPKLPFDNLPVNGQNDQTIMHSAHSWT